MNKKSLYMVIGVLVIAAIAYFVYKPGTQEEEAKITLRIANLGEPASIDPHKISGTWENRIVINMFTGLMTEDPKAEPVLGMATSWEASADGKTYTFKIGDYNWSDGEPVTAGDFEFSLRRILNPETASKYASLLYAIKNAEKFNKGELQDAAQIGVRAVDSKTLEVELENPTPYFISQLTHYTSYPLPKHVVEKHGNDWIKAENIVSNGPYVLKEYMPNQHVHLVKNSNWHEADQVQITDVFYYPGEDRSQAVKRFRADEVDVVADLPSEQIEMLRSELSAELRIAPYLGTYYYTLNVTKPPFDNKGVRQAIAMAIDRKKITDDLLKTGEVPAFSFVPPGTANYGEPAYVSWHNTSYTERLEMAKQLLEEAGYGPDNPLKFVLRYNTSENHKRIAVAIADMLKDLNVEVELFNSEVAVHYAELNENNFEAGRAGWIADYNDAQNFLFLLEERTGAYNYSRFNNAEYNALMLRASETTDLIERAGYMRMAEAIAMEEMPYVPIYYYVSKQLVSTKVSGWLDNTADRHQVRYLKLAVNNTY